MRKELQRGTPSRDRSGRVGSVLRVDFRRENVGEWAGHARIETHGLTAAEIAERVGRAEVVHALKQQRLTAYAKDCVGAVEAIGGVEYTITDCTIRARGTDHELYISARSDDGRAPGMPLSITFGSIDETPSPSEIRATIRDSIESARSESEAHNAVVEEAIRLIAGG